MKRLAVAMSVAVCAAAMFASAAIPAGASAGGSVLAWGAYPGNGTVPFAGDSAPAPVAVPTDTVAIMAGGTFLTQVAGGVVWAWGVNTGIDPPAAPDTPAEVPALAGATAMSSGSLHDLAVLPDGSVVAWGDNQYGQLGDGSTTDSTTPVPVLGLGNVVGVAAGEVHSLALKADGTVWAWGHNHDGELGDGTTTDRHLPVTVPSLSGVVAIAAGGSGPKGFSLALKSDGTVWAWGYNSSGELGDGTFVESHVPVQVSGIGNVAAIDAGYQFSLALKSDGTVWGWGDNKAGELGTGGSPSKSDVPLQTTGLSGVTAVSAHGNDAMALAGGAVWTWGDGYFGQLGNCTTFTTASVPVRLTGISGATAIAAGYETGLALRPGGPYPVVNSFVPAGGPVGKKITFMGSGFRQASSVTFNGVAATFTKISDRELTAQVPDGALTGCVLITNGNGPGESQTLLVKPQITGFTPGSGPPGTPVSISGSAFTGAMQVTFGGTDAPGFVVVAYGTISVLVPVGGHTGPIRVTTPGGTTKSVSNFTVT